MHVLLNVLHVSTPVGSSVGLAPLCVPRDVVLNVTSPVLRNVSSLVTRTVSCLVPRRVVDAPICATPALVCVLEFALRSVKMVVPAAPICVAGGATVHVVEIVSQIALRSALIPVVLLVLAS